MACPRSGPCAPFATQLDLCCLVSGGFEDPCITGTNEPIPQAIIDNALEAASEILWAMTGRQFGTCQVKIRPCGSGDGCNPCPDGGEIPFWSTSSGASYGFDWSSFPWVPSMDSNGVWTNISCSCKDCCDICHIDLPYPVCSVDEVKIDGRVLEENEYRVDDFRQLIRLRGPVATEGFLRLTSSAAGPNAADDAWCFTVEPDSVTDAVLIPNTNFCYDATGAVPDFEWNNTSGFTATYQGGADLVPEDGAFQLHNSLGIASWPINNTPMVPGEKRRSLPGPNGEYIEVTFISGDDLFYGGINWQRAGAASFQVEYFTIQAAENLCWPECQALHLEDTEFDTFSVTVTYGREVPALVKLAAAELACQFIKACAGQPCLLPQRVQSISRQGVTVGFLDPMDFLAEGRTGIYIVDLAAKTFNPYKLLKQASVYSPDVGRKWRRTDT